MARYIDVHSHLSSYPDVDGVVKRARLAGIEKIISVGVNYKRSKEALQLSKIYPGIVFPAVGISYGFAGKRKPYETEEHFLQRYKPLDLLLKEVEDIEKLLKIEGKKIVAIGEIGIDTGITKEDRYEDQKVIFRKFLELAEQYRKGVMVHSFSSAGYSNSERDALEILSCYNIKPIIMHFFQGGKEETKIAIDMGCYFSVAPRDVSGNLYSSVERVVKQVDIRKLVIESDGPRPKDGVINFDIQPDVLPKIVENIATIKRKNVEETRCILYENAEKLF